MFADWFDVWGLAVVAAPAAMLAVLGLASLFDVRLNERLTTGFVQLCLWIGFASSLGMLAAMAATETPRVSLDLGDWIRLPSSGEGMSQKPSFAFHIELIFDRLSLPMLVLSYLLCGVVATFASRYLHREPGFHRFFVCFSVFTLGMIATAVAGTIELLFFGWELVGLSSAVLVAFFHERVGPLRNGLRVWTVYRLSDAAFLVAAVALHHATGSGDFDAVMGSSPWPGGESQLGAGAALTVGGLLLVAAAGKSALIPFCGWLPRAMEGPTPSSAIFYGALSVHLGAFLLLRVCPLLNASPALAAAAVVLGLATAAAAAVIGRAQSDIKSSLAFASLTQVGIIVAEIGCGLRAIALAHLIGHAVLRTLQLLRAPTLLHDYHTLENALGSHLQPHRGEPPAGQARRWRSAIYRFALERGDFDAALDQWICRPFERLVAAATRFEQRICGWLREGETPEPAAADAWEESNGSLR